MQTPRQLCFLLVADSAQKTKTQSIRSCKGLIDWFQFQLERLWSQITTSLQNWAFIFQND